MDKDFDFVNIGKRTPYRTPDNFFEWRHSVRYWNVRLTSNARSVG